MRRWFIARLLLQDEFLHVLAVELAFPCLEEFNETLAVQVGETVFVTRGGPCMEEKGVKGVEGGEGREGDGRGGGAGAEL